MSVRVVLVGLPGVGKTTIGAALAAELGCEFCDLDDVVAARTGAPVADVLRDRGEPSFRALEAEALRATLDEARDVVLATGGGIVEAPASRALLHDAPLVVQLVAPVDVVLGRLGGVDRPLLATPSRAALDALAARRRAWYEEVADADVEAIGPIGDVVDDVARLVVRT